MLVLLYSYNSRGPGKVISNLKKGLDSLGVPYVENPNSIAQDDLVVALQWSNMVHQVNPENLILGPNICTLPIDNNYIMNGSYKYVIVPSQWVKDLYMRWLPEEKIKIWASGIDTDEFPDVSKEEKSNDVLLYLKNRVYDVYDFALSSVPIDASYQTIAYGGYSEVEFKDALKRSKMCVVVDDTESQGIAIQEIMASNIPLVVLDKTRWNTRDEAPDTPATSVPYWDERCGIKVIQDTDLKEAIKKVYDNIGSYSPRDYILGNLSLETSASNLLQIFEK